MLSAAVAINENTLDKLNNPAKALGFFEHMLKSSKAKKIEILVFPGLFGGLWQDGRDFLRAVSEISKAYKGIYLCPGSFWERDGDKLYHSSCILSEGETILWQRQLYLSKWERLKGVSRGDELNIVTIGSSKLGIIMPTDAFYPQVSRRLALMGVDIVAAPTAIVNSKGSLLQMSGVWQNVQQNLFYAVESSLKGALGGSVFYGISAIHAPLEATEDSTGYLALEKEQEEGLVIAELDLRKRLEAAERFNTLKHMNMEFCSCVFSGDKLQGGGQ